MKTQMIAASALLAALATPLAAFAAPAPVPSFQAEKCYGVAKAGLNDCQTATHSCAGTSTKNMDPALLDLRAGRHLREDRRRQYPAVLTPSLGGPESAMTNPIAEAPRRAGIGLRGPHLAAVVASPPAVGFLEVHPENYMGGGPALSALERLRRDRPISLHGVGLSLGGTDGVDAGHLARLAALVERLEPAPGLRASFLEHRRGRSI